MAYRKVFGSNSEDKEADLESGIVGGGAAPTSQGTGGNTSAWTNLQTYLEANEGQGAGIANAITQKTQANIDAVGKNVQDWEGEAKKRVDEKTRNDDYSSQIKKDPTEVNQSAFSAWKNLGNYWGAQDATGDSGYAEVYGKAKNAADDIKGANDYYGQNVLAKKSFTGDQAGQSRNYTDGMGYLDTFIARADQSGKDAFSNFKDKNTGFDQKIDSAKNNLNSYIQGAGSRGQAAYDSAMNAISGKQKEIHGAADQRFRGASDLNVGKQMNFDLYDQVYPDVGIQQRAEAGNHVDLNKNFDVSDVYSQADVDALNSLAGLDNDEATTASYAKGSDAAFSTDSYKKYLDDHMSRQRQVTPKQQAQIDAAAREGFATAGGFTGQGPIDISNTQSEIDYRAGKAFEDAGGFRGNPEVSIVEPPKPKSEPERKSKNKKIAKETDYR